MNNNESKYRSTRHTLLKKLFVKPKGLHKITNRFINVSLIPLRNWSVQFELLAYGHGDALCDFCGIPLESVIANLSAEHGNIFWSPPRREHSQWVKRHAGKHILVFSKFREKQLNSYGINATAIGPFLHYAKLPCKENFSVDKYRNELGKTLVHFPVFRKTSDDETQKITFAEHVETIKQLEQIKNEQKFDTILICLKSNDIFPYRTRIQLYKNKGFYFVCCGGVTSSAFLSHLKFLMEIADLVTTNYFSTIVGYAYLFQKKFYLVGFRNFHERTKTKEWLIPEVLKIEDTLHYEPNRKKHNPLSHKQVISFIENRWGFDSILDREELRGLLHGETPT